MEISRLAEKDAWVGPAHYIGLSGLVENDYAGVWPKYPPTHLTLMHYMYIWQTH